ncbi:hypothetical protein FACS1894133_6960 [Clostridia bacterium]|nr:hypothetical protein FACS1894133_6960 [Clostridia bacterium]
MRISKKTPSVDIHGLDRVSAERRVKDFITALPRGTDKAVVIHGFTNGNVLRDMVRGLWHERVDTVVGDFANDGVSVIYLNTTV